MTRKCKIQILLLTLGILFSGFGPAAWGERIEWPDYLRMGPAEKARLVKRSVYFSGQKIWETRNFKYHVETKVSPELALQVGVLMDNFHSQFSAIFPAGLHDSVQSQALVLRSESEYRNFLQSQGVDPGFSCGIFMPSRKTLVTYRQENFQMLREVLFHEGAHQILCAYCVGKDIPVWFAEGIATNFETWDLAQSPAENVRFGIVRAVQRLIPMAEAVENKEPIRLADLLGLTHEQWESAKDPDLNYATAWSFVNFLLNNPQGQTRLNRIFQGFMKGDPIRRILPPEAVRQLQSEWQNDCMTRILLYARAIGPATELMKNQEFDEAAAVLSRGIKRYPDLADGYYFRGKLYLERKKFSQARSDLEKAAAFKTDYPGVGLLCARACLGEGDFKQARVYAQKALRKSPRDKAGRQMLVQIDQARRGIAAAPSPKPVEGTEH